MVLNSHLDLWGRTTSHKIVKKTFLLWIVENENIYDLLLSSIHPHDKNHHGLQIKSSDCRLSPFYVEIRPDVIWIKIINVSVSRTFSKRYNHNHGICVHGSALQCFAMVWFQSIVPISFIITSFVTAPVMKNMRKPIQGTIWIWDRLSNERRRYTVNSSSIGWTHTQNYHRDQIYIWYIHNKALQHRVYISWDIQCRAVITRSIFSQTFTRDTP